MSLDIYKRGQGYYTRLFSALCLVVIVACGCYALYNKLQGKNIWIETLVPASVFVAFGIFIYWFANKPRVADFLIAAEGEIKKVSWSSRKEIMASTIVVVSVVLLMAGWLWAWDMGFQFLFRYVIKIY